MCCIMLFIPALALKLCKGLRSLVSDWQDCLLELWWQFNMHPAELKLAVSSKLYYSICPAGKFQRSIKPCGQIINLQGKTPLSPDIFWFHVHEQLFALILESLNHSTLYLITWLSEWQVSYSWRSHDFCYVTSVLSYLDVFLVLYAFEFQCYGYCSWSRLLLKFDFLQRGSDSIIFFV